MSVGCTVRALRPADAAQALALYTELTFGPECTDTDAFMAVVRHPGTKVFGGFVTSALVGMTTLHLLPNVTRGARPYALIENVVTASDCRNKGVGRAVMQAAIDAAWQADAYKIMLLTDQRGGAKGFYETLGFSGEDKFGLILHRPKVL